VGAVSNRKRIVIRATQQKFGVVYFAIAPPGRERSKPLKITSIKDLTIDTIYGIMEGDWQNY